MGRPRKTINKAIFEGLCKIQCTKLEICSAFDCTDKTLEAWCKRTYQNNDGEPMGFSEVFALKRGRGKISLRRAQLQLAEKSAAMAIWLGKQYLGQREPGPMAPEAEQQPDDGFLEALRGEAAEAWEED